MSTTNGTHARHAVSVVRGSPLSRVQRVLTLHQAVQELAEALPHVEVAGAEVEAVIGSRQRLAALLLAGEMLVTEGYSYSCGAMPYPAPWGELAREHYRRRTQKVGA